jgi:hypothetical protein
MFEDFPEIIKQENPSKPETLEEKTEQKTND